MFNPIFSTFLQHPYKYLIININFEILGVAMRKTGNLKFRFIKNYQG
jgi:hypothetical protein